MVKKSYFKGLEISDMKFERKKVKCSEVVKDSCGTRDCNLEQYKLGDDIILSGGLCPKGNTGSFAKKAPDYVRMYLNILDEHLKKISRTIDDPEDNGIRIYIPRSMTFLNEKGVFYSSIYHNLGFDVRISPESNEEISNLGKMSSHSEFCYPVILAHGHALYIKQKMREQDKLLLVDAISVSNKRLKFCPYVASAGHVISANISIDKNKLLLPVIYFDDKKHKIHKVIYNDLNRLFKDKFSISQVKDAVEKAKINEINFLNEVYSKGNEIVENLVKNNEKIYFGIGRGYTLFDNKASSGVHELFIINGLHFIPSYFLNNVDTTDLAENMYWFQGKRMLNYTKDSLENNNLFPVRLTNFNCGPDSILYYHEEKLVNNYNKPWLVLETDGHNSNAQFGTRIMAHNRVVDKYIKKHDNVIIENNNLRGEDFSNRLLGIPYMGDSADILAAAFRSCGINAVVMPTRTVDSITLSKKLVKTNTCQPFSFQIGDHIAWLESLKEKGIDVNEKAALFLPTTRGPCRFGQYSVILKNLLDERGFNRVPVINPNSTTDYSDVNLPMIKINTIVRRVFKGNLANELLFSCLLRTRPYEKNKGESDELYNRLHKELIVLIEKKSNLKELVNFLEKSLEEFQKIDKDDSVRYPLVLMGGEIFVRNHEKSNYDSARLLEKYKLEVVIDPIFVWIDYINKDNIRKSIKDKRLFQLGKSFLKKAYLSKVLKSLFEPLKDYLERREIHNVFELIDNAEKDMVYTSHVGGESCVSIGSAYSFVQGKLPIDGIYHVGPFGCMQETISTSRSQALLQEERGKSLKSGEDKVMPYLDAVFGEVPISNLESQIAIFAENCWLKKRQREGK
jgi:predicted nucleotide-binding protein (sugar kinase/HSP70/actin superfamily)